MSEPKCQWVVKMLPAYLDRELPRPESEAVRQHLRHCQSCQARARLLDETWETLEEVEQAPRQHVRRVSPNFTERMMARVEAEKQRRVAEAQARRRQVVRQVIVAVTGLAAGLVLGLVLYGWTALEPAPPDNPVEQEISHNVTFLEDCPLVDEMAMIQLMDRLATQQNSGGGA
jgi:anti-sigma factor RsiW